MEQASAQQAQEPDGAAATAASVDTTATVTTGTETSIPLKDEESAVLADNTIKDDKGHESTSKQEEKAPTKAEEL
jgi:hypothetical protein